MAWEVMTKGLDCRAGQASFVIDTRVSSTTILLYFIRRRTNLKQNVANFLEKLEKPQGASGMYVSNPPLGVGAGEFDTSRYPRFGMKD